MSESLIIQNVPPSAITSITTGDTTVFTVNIRPNSVRHCRILTRSEITTSGTTAAGTITFKLKANGTTLIDNYQSGGAATFNFKSDAVARINQFYTEWIGDLSQGGAISLTVTASIADTGTTITPKSFYIIAIG